MMPADFYRNSGGLRRRTLTLPRRELSTASLLPEMKDAEEVLLMNPAEPPPPPFMSPSFLESACSAAKATGAVDIDGDVWGDNTVKGSAAAISHGLISLMGRRRVMVDAVTAISTLFPPELTQSRRRFFAVYGGSTASGTWKERLHHLLAEEMGGGGLVVEWERVVKMSFARMEKEVCESNEEASEDGEGCGRQGRVTAVVVVVSAEELVVASCGDTRAVICRGGVAVQLSHNLKATSPSQPEGPDDMEAADEGVIDSYVDEHFLRPDVISIPEVTVWPRTPSDDFLVLASNGLWDVLSNDAACELVKSYLVHEQSSPRRRILIEESSCTDSCAANAASMLAEMAVARGSRENVSVIVVMLTRQV